MSEVDGVVVVPGCVEEEVQSRYQGVGSGDFVGLHCGHRQDVAGGVLWVVGAPGESQYEGGADAVDVG
ncbi:hypothetical protein ACWEKT_20425 [Nocardia takedensis]